MTFAAWERRRIARTCPAVRFASPDAIVIDNRWFHSFIEHAGLTAKVELLEK
jgi:hypothetical protein